MNLLVTRAKAICNNWILQNTHTLTILSMAEEIGANLMQYRLEFGHIL